MGQDAEGGIYDDAGENELNMVNTFDQDNKNRGKGKGFLHLAPAGKQEFYSPLGEPDLRDLPSFAHQISQGMVCMQKHVIQMPLISMHDCIIIQTPWYSSITPGLPHFPGYPPP